MDEFEPSRHEKELNPLNYIKSSSLTTDIALEKLCYLYTCKRMEQRYLLVNTQPKIICSLQSS